MTAASFGFALPLDYGKLAKGMLVLAAPSASEQYFGVVTKLHHDFLLVTLAGSEGTEPSALDLSNCPGDLWLVPGSLELEPGGKTFWPGERRSHKDGYKIDAEGNILASFVARSEFGQAQRYLVDLGTGEHAKPAGETAHVGDVQFYIRQEGRKERFPWRDLTSEQ